MAHVPHPKPHTDNSLTSIGTGDGDSDAIL